MCDDADEEAMDVAETTTAEDQSEGKEDDRLATNEEIEKACREASLIFTKPPPDRDRLYKAIYGVVSGRLAIKEASLLYNFATSTMHPYVHRARSFLSAKPPPQKFAKPVRNRTNIAVKSDSTSAENGGVGQLSDEIFQMGQSFGLDLRNNDAPKAEQADANDDLRTAEVQRESVCEAVFSPAKTPPTAYSNSKVDANFSDEAASTEEIGRLEIDESADERPTTDNEGVEKTKFYFAEDAVRQVLDEQGPRHDDGQTEKLFLAAVQCLNGDISAQQACNTYALSHSSLIQLVGAAKGLMVGQPAAAEEPIAGEHTPFVERLETACRQIVSSSHYDESRKGKLFEALFLTMKGDLALTQAAANYSIPFSTLHPYVKRLKARLADVEERSNTSAGAKVGVAGDSGSKRRVKCQNQQLAGGPSVGSASPTKSFNIPQRWKNEPQLMKAAVMKAVRTCQYANEEKRERLCAAILEALSGQSTMKAAAIGHSVPFTTLQTYYHRSRAQLQYDNPELSVGGESSTRPQPLPPPESVPSKPVAPSKQVDLQSRKSNLDALFSRLREQKEQEGSDSVESGSADKAGDVGVPSSPAVVLFGSNKRKPKKVVRQVAEKLPSASTKSEEVSLNMNHDFDYMKNENSAIDLSCPSGTGNSHPHRDRESGRFEEKVHVVEPTAPEETHSASASPQCYKDQQKSSFRTNSGSLYGGKLNRSVGDAAVKRDAEGNVVLTNAMVVDRAIRNTHYDGFHRQKLRSSILDTLDGTLPMREAAKQYNIPLGTLHTYFHRAKAMLDYVEQGYTVEQVLNMSASETNALTKVKKKGPVAELVESLLTNDDTDAVLQEICKHIIAPSLYAAEQKERLCRAVYLVVRGQMTINAAANDCRLPSSTVHPYVHRARAALGPLCPPQASGLNSSTSYGAVAKRPRLAEQPQRTGTSGSGSVNKASSECSEETAEGAAGSESAGSEVDYESSSAALELNEQARQIGLTVERLDGMSATQVLKEVKKAAESHSRPEGTPPINLEDADRVVTELISKSNYDEEGRQRLYEAVIMVITDNATGTEAARTYGLPPSTIQPYVQKARGLLNMPANLPGVPLSSGVSSTKKPPMANVQRVYASVSQQADEEEIANVIQEVTKTASQPAGRKDKLFQAVFAAVSGKMTIKDACSSQGLPASTVHPYVSRARHVLGEKCPKPKVIAAPSSHAYSPQPKCGDSFENSKTNNADVKLGAPPVGGEEPPTSKGGASSSSGSSPTPAVVSASSRKKQLEQEVNKILGRYNFRGDKKQLVDAIITVIVERKTLAEVSLAASIAQTTLSTYVRIARLFIKDQQMAFDSPTEQAEATSPPTAANETNELVSPISRRQPQIPEEALPIESNEAADDKVSRSEKREEDEEDEKDAKNKSDRAQLERWAKTIAELLGASDLTDWGYECKVRTVIRHLASTQYRRGHQQQEALIEAVEDVLVNGLSDTEAIQIHSTRSKVSKHVFLAYLARTRDAVELFDEPLRQLYGLASSADFSTPACFAVADPTDRKTAEEHTTPTKRNSSNSSHEGELSIHSPTRMSRRLAAKAEAAEKEQEHANVPDDTLLPAELEKLLGAFFRRLENSNFPLTQKIYIGLVKDLISENRLAGGVAAPPKHDGDWINWLSCFKKRNNLK